jgi:hypothetical protein
MKTLFIGLALLCLGAIDAKADGSPSFTAGYSSYTVVAVRCSTGTTIQVNSRPAGFQANIAGYRAFNPNVANVFFGGSTINTATAVGSDLTNFGRRLVTNTAETFNLGKLYSRLSVPLVPLFCRAEDSAGSGGAVISVEWFGY